MKVIINVAAKRGAAAASAENEDKAPVRKVVRKNTRKAAAKAAETTEPEPKTGGKRKKGEPAQVRLLNITYTTCHHLHHLHTIQLRENSSLRPCTTKNLA